MSASLPRPGIPLINERGLMEPEWYRFFAQFGRDFVDSATTTGTGLTETNGVWSIADNGVGNDKLRDSPALSVMGNGTDVDADPQDILATRDGHFLQRDGDSVLFRPPRLPSYTIAELPNAPDLGTATLVWISDEVGGPVIAFSDGTDWQRVTNAPLTGTYFEVVDDTVNWGPSSWRAVPATNYFTIGDNTVEGSATFNKGGGGPTQPGSLELAHPGYTGSLFMGGNPHGRIGLSTFGTITGVEFNVVPYVGVNAIFHAGANKAAAQANSVAATVAALVTDFNALLAKLRTAALMAP